MHDASIDGDPAGRATPGMALEEFNLVDRAEPDLPWLEIDRKMARPELGHPAEIPIRSCSVGFGSAGSLGQCKEARSHTPDRPRIGPPSASAIEPGAPRVHRPEAMPPFIHEFPFQHPPGSGTATHSGIRAPVNSPGAKDPWVARTEIRQAVPQDLTRPGRRMTTLRSPAGVKGSRVWARVLASSPGSGELGAVKTLLMMRHAKSDWDADYSRDHDRPLNERGTLSARVMGAVLSERSLAPDLVISSTAVRARTTAELAAEAGGWNTTITLEPILYGASPHEVIDVASDAPSVARLMLVGHQPTWAATVYELTGTDVVMKTATVAVIESPIDSWAELSPGVARLVEALYSRDFM